MITTRNICVTLTSSNPEVLFKQLQKYPFVELRLDFIKPEISLLKKILEKSNNILVTFKSSLTEKERTDYLNILLQNGKVIVDFDISAISLEEITKMQQAGLQVMASYHNFESTPSAEFLNSILENEIAKKVDFIKIVSTAHSSKDIEQIQNLYLSKKGNLIAFCMGNQGIISRPECLSWGSPISYAHPDEEQEVAPGQLSFTEMKSKLCLR